MIKLMSLAIIAVLLGGCGLNFNPGTGEKIGQVIRLSKQGIFVETWEAELIRGGLSGGSGAFGVHPFFFTVEDDKTAEQIQKYIENSTEVVVRYRAKGIYSAFSTDSGGLFLVSITPVSR